MTSRQQRLDDAINASMVKPHELSFEQLISWAQQFAQQLPFRNLRDQIEGDWGSLFQKSEIVVCAAISTSSIRQIQAQFKHAMGQSEVVTAEFLFVLLKRLQAWYQHLPSTPDTAYQFRYYLLHEYQYHLSLPLSLMVSRLPEQFRHNVQELDELWKLDQQKLATASRALQHDSFIDHMRHCFAKIVYVIKQIKKHSQKVLQTALMHQDNAPQQALYFSFLKLFKLAQKKLNTFTERHLQFYYQRVLQQEKKPAEDNSIYLKLSLNSQTKNTIKFDHGAEFSPGDAPDFSPIIYRSCYPIEITNAEVSHVFNLTLQRDPLVSPEKETGLVCGVSGQKLKVTANATGDNFPFEQRFNIFSNKHKHGNNTQPMGLIITDPIFSMQQGNRVINIVFHLKEVRSNIISQELLAVSENTTEVLTRVFSLLLNVHAHLFEDWVTRINASSLVKQVSAEQLNELQKLKQSQRVWVAYKLFYSQLVHFICSTTDKGEQYGLAKIDFLFRVIGQITSRRCLYNVPWLTEADISEILTTIEPLLTEEPTAYTTIKELLSYSPIAAFYQLFQGVFQIDVSTENGWETLTDVEINPCESHECKIGLKVKCNIDTGFKPVIPVDDSLPHSASLKITLKRQSNCFPYAIFRDFELAKLAITTQVAGVTQMQLFNPEGQVDSAQPFFLFGSLPYIDAYAVIANEEIARKTVSQLSLHLDWGDLPRGSDGFQQYYAQYPYHYTNASFQVTPEVLKNGQWTEFGPSQLPLFTPGSGVLHHGRVFRFTNMNNCYTPVTHSWPKTPYSNQSGLRNGLFKLRLTGPEYAFGHKDYAPLLSDILTHNVTKKRKKSLPNPPYTPLVTHISIDYSAESTIDLISASDDNAMQSKVVHLHPFGERVIYPRAQTRQLMWPRFFPNYKEDSHCFIGITATELSGYLNLFFVFDGSSKLLMPYPSTSYTWYYLVDNEWHAFNPNQIIHDTTLNFLTTGIVTLDIPSEINTGHSVMPSGLFWLRVSTNKGVDHYPDCLHVATHVVTVAGKGAPLSADGVTVMPFSAWRSTPRKANLATIAQLNAMKKTPEIESDHAFQVRVSESLRHKGKALTPWDYEHLVLENFPEVGSVHCFPTRTFSSQCPVPGHVLIIVTPLHTTCDHSPCIPKQLDSSYLLNIRRFLLAISRPQVQIEVRNPGYEKIQIRCKVTLKEGVNHGPVLRRLEYAIKTQLCPWEQNTLNTGLGFCLSLEKLSAFIRRQEDVVEVSALSALKISVDDDTDYTLLDSAVNSHPIRAAYPWYLLIPVEHHYIQISPDNLIHDPVAVGIGELVIGEQFIVSTSTTSNQKGTKK
ncbi:hypothetical protein A9B99_04175 [Mangrovibacter phragmitis]|uniref:Baseplate protein J-like domain-containing protein n=1 Tax=Mangrovibacter phragmitis TaxID=1691903 RepID=A0A1B7L984_9ENTR|nr:hypothetical protein [Mangrovibacter phragmitis]OAT78902.1 hypothetical protein A9B99_04175 [Mangrovibacter phragmitis]